MIENIDATVIAQKPKLRPYIEQMEQNVADTLQIAKEDVYKRQVPDGGGVQCTGFL